MNNIIAGRIRAHMSELSEAYGKGMTTGRCLFQWFVRHVAWNYLRFARREEGVARFRILRGHDYKSLMMVFGEVGLFRIADLTSQSKARPRWFKGVKVGKAESSDEHLMPTPSGVERVRNIQRLSGSCCWDPDFLASIAGLPWAMFDPTSSRGE